jgi:molecular chaperone IbpA
MRNLDLKHLFPYSVGFDELHRALDAAARDGGRDTSYPPYDIIKTGPSAYRITMAVAGFREDDLDLSVQENVLTVRGRIAEQDKETAYLHRGIARRPFEHRFQLADHVKVTGARLDHGLLDIELAREVPETAKPQSIKIGR